jgi:tRNA pseudouridine55 synthase
LTTDGLVVVDKPAGMTSHDVVGWCRRAFGQKKVGHAGTLDPDATGVLIVGLGRVTRLMQYMTGLDKEYTTEIVLGAATATMDDSGPVTGTWDMTAIGVEQSRAAAAALTGPIAQIPPMVSAVKVGGQRLHHLARQGIEVERAPRSVTVTRFDVEPAGDGVLAATIACSSGTYVRVLADDLGRRLGGGAHLRRLRRTAVGPWQVTDAVALDQIGPEHVLAPAAALPWLEAVRVEGDVEAAVRYGRPLTGDDLGATGSGPWRVIGSAGHLLAVYEAHRRVVLVGG